MDLKSVHSGFVISIGFWLRLLLVSIYSNGIESQSCISSLNGFMCVVKSYSIFRVTSFVLKLIVEVFWAATGRNSRFRLGSGKGKVMGGTRRNRRNTKSIATCQEWREVFYQFFEWYLYPAFINCDSFCFKINFWHW